MKRINTRQVIIFLIAAVILTAGIVIYAQQKNDPKHESCPLTAKQADKSEMPEDCPMMRKADSQTSDAKTDETDEHHKTMMVNGEREMGFSQVSTTHHFLIMKDGGAIQVEANDAADTANRDKIRAHLTGIAEMFQNGDFKTPFAVHSRIPPGVPEMEKLKAEIRYAYEETGRGARVRITTANPEALAAVHRFLKFQIEDHRTGDATSVND